MDNTKLLNLSLIFSIVGLLTILFISEAISPKFYPISEINEKMIDQTISTLGKISLIKQTKNFTIFSLKDNNSKILVIVWKENQIHLKKNTEVKIIGKILKYGKDLEIEAIEIIRR